MSKLSISEQIKTLRRAKGLSQENLAESARINLRTLQRIEAGDTIPRGETLRLLAQVLDVRVESLTPTLAEDTAFLKLLNLSALAFWIFPFGNVIVPLVLWINKRNEVAGVMGLGKRILNFQITWSILVYGFTTVTIIGLMSGQFFFHPFLMVGFCFLMAFLNTAVILTTHFRIVKGEGDYYGIGLRIIQ
ncbi:helix-turn-helix domain-containing protein [Dyadobacter fermentans]|uniref:Transcriptional regulator, XRE family n=1 Tax=Dyadobacter fermentans (strain ATCC 700827 / DSM 18053 / CIP 107007 / KCTC 52180 / NS114) TaxID=471854 RepID=C6W707_DYAFD|nr:helix-turn-helix domain-containing protein [Dyadobacter fermentans]ACT92616.1 transcriptional regulator, XRE family [Dyadobacter fermentans DSM 18053]